MCGNAAHLTESARTYGSINCSCWDWYVLPMEGEVTFIHARSAQRAPVVPLHMAPLGLRGLQSLSASWACINLSAPASPHLLPYLSPVLTYAPSSWEGWTFLLHQQFVRWPLSESANQVANSDVDTCPFGTGMKTAPHFLETIKHPVCEQQFSLNCNMGKTWRGHTDRYLLIRSSTSFNVLEIDSFISLQYSAVWEAPPF